MLVCYLPSLSDSYYMLVCYLPTWSDSYYMLVCYLPTWYNSCVILGCCGLYLQARLAQSVEHETLNLRVVGSSPTLGVDLLIWIPLILRGLGLVSWTQIIVLH